MISRVTTRPSAAAARPLLSPAARPRPWAALGLAAALVAAAAAGWGCTSDLVRPSCDGALRLVAHGTVNQRAVTVESLAIGGRWLEETFYLEFADPHQAGGYWLLQFGYNPEMDDLGFAHPVNLATDMQPKVGTPFSVRSHLPDPAGSKADQRCEPRNGELCGGLRVYAPGMYDPKNDLPGDVPDAAYLPVISGQIAFDQFSNVAMTGSYSLALDYDREHPTQGTGELDGCFQASRVKGLEGDQLE